LLKANQRGGYVQVKQIIAELEVEIARLREARALLTGDGFIARKRGRPAKATVARKTTRKHRLSPEGRKRISDALKRRWAAQRKAKAK
jgi:Mn-dependent DtxR family transcriptional regulator